MSRAETGAFPPLFEICHSLNTVRKVMGVMTSNFWIQAIGTGSYCLQRWSKPDQKALPQFLSVEFTKPRVFLSDALASASYYTLSVVTESALETLCHYTGLPTDGANKAAIGVTSAYCAAQMTHANWDSAWNFAGNSFYTLKGRFWNPAAYYTLAWKRINQGDAKNAKAALAQLPENFLTANQALDLAVGFLDKANDPEAAFVNFSTALTSSDSKIQASALGGKYLAIFDIAKRDVIVPAKRTAIENALMYFVCLNSSPYQNFQFEILKLFQEQFIPVELKTAEDYYSTGKNDSKLMRAYTFFHIALGKIQPPQSQTLLYYQCLFQIAQTLLQVAGECLHNPSAYDEKVVVAPLLTIKSTPPTMTEQKNRELFVTLVNQVNSRFRSFNTTDWKTAFAADKQLQQMQSAANDLKQEAKQLRGSKELLAEFKLTQAQALEVQAEQRAGFLTESLEPLKMKAIHLEKLTAYPQKLLHYLDYEKAVKNLLPILLCGSSTSPAGLLIDLVLIINSYSLPLIYDLTIKDLQLLEYQSKEYQFEALLQTHCHTLCFNSDSKAQQAAMEIIAKIIDENKVTAAQAIYDRGLRIKLENPLQAYAYFRLVLEKFDRPGKLKVDPQLQELLDIRKLFRDIDAQNMSLTTTISTAVMQQLQQPLKVDHKLPDQKQFFTHGFELRGKLERIKDQLKKLKIMDVEIAEILIKAPAIIEKLRVKKREIIKEKSALYYKAHYHLGDIMQNLANKDQHMHKKTYLLNRALEHYRIAEQVDPAILMRKDSVIPLKNHVAVKISDVQRQLAAIPSSRAPTNVPVGLNSNHLLVRNSTGNASADAAAERENADHPQSLRSLT